MLNNLITLIKTSNPLIFNLITLGDMKKINPILQVRYEGIGYKGIRIQSYFPIPLFLYSSLFLLELIISNPLNRKIEPITF